MNESPSPVKSAQCASLGRSEAEMSVFYLAVGGWFCVGREGPCATGRGTEGRGAGQWASAAGQGLLPSWGTGTTAPSPPALLGKGFVPAKAAQELMCVFPSLWLVFQLSR